MMRDRRWWMGPICLSLCAAGLASELAFGQQYNPAAPIGPPAAAPRQPAGPNAPLGPPTGAPLRPPGPVAAPQRRAQVQILVPDWANTLPPEHLKYLDQVLTFWEAKSKQIQKFRCSFERWSYNPGGFGPADPNIPSSHSAGTIKYERPDKGLFKVDTITFYTPPRAAGQQATYEARPGEFGEHWVCDGKAIFEFRPNQKELAEIRLPPEMQGKAIANGPLPFLFGAEATELKKRYWMRVITPKGAQNQYWIEAWPKYQNDAANFKKVEVILSVTDFLPDAMQLFSPAGKERTVFQFSDRKINGSVDEVIDLFRKSFYKPDLPSGWKKTVEEVQSSGPPGGQPAPLSPPPGQVSGPPVDPRTTSLPRTSLPR